MTTKRSPNKIVEREGIRYVQGIVEDNNCIYQEILQGNDQGNDCYIEFVDENNVSTSFLLFSQIKSGASYKDKKGYKIPAKKSHLEYWNNFPFPVIGIVYDQDLKKAFWINIKEYLVSRPFVLQQDYHSICVSANAEFSYNTFPSFRNYFIAYIKRYKTEENFGRSLEMFSQVDNPTICYHGLKSPFSNHRDKQAAWYYIIANFGNITEPGIHLNILGMISNYSENPYTLWHSGNKGQMATENEQRFIEHALTRCFKEREVGIAMSFMQRSVVAGSFSYLIYLVLAFIDGIEDILYRISYDNRQSPEDRNFSFWLYIHFAKGEAPELVLEHIEEYLRIYPNCDEDYIIRGMKETIINKQFLPIG